jgi:SdrD B-like domain
MKVKKYLVIIGILLICILAGAISASAVSGAAFTTYNPWVDGDFKDVCKNTRIDCNIYGAKPDVWLNGGPTANGLGPDGDYFFAVLVPGGQPDPNDGGAKNLSDDYDAYTNRIFTVQSGEVYSYTGTHDLDSGDFVDPDRHYCTSKRGCEPDGSPPLIRLFPYADTTNPGGVYILAICSLDRGYPVYPRDCKYDAFKVKEVPLTMSLRLSGIKFEDKYADGKDDWEEGVYEDPGLEGWEVTIEGTGLLGEVISETVTTNADGFWSFQKDYTYNKFTVPVPAELTICEVLQEGWVQSYPDPECYERTIEPAALAEVEHLDFGNWYPGEKSGMKFEDLNADGVKDEDELGLAGWTIFVDYNSNGEQDEGEPYDVTDADGKYTITGIKPGEWTILEVLQEGWTCSYPDPCSYEHEFYSHAVYEDNDFGNWYPATKSGYKWYDRNGDGIWDEGEPAIDGWTIEVYAGENLEDSMLTDEFGYYEFSLKPGTYTVKEVCPAANWVQTWPEPTDGCGSGVYEVTLVSRQEETDNDFGNYCVGYADFDTKGYWHNKNGLSELYNDPDFPALLAYINSLAPYDDPTDYFDNGDEPFDGFFENGDPVPPAIDAFSDYGYLYNEISQFLVDPNAQGGGADREQLAQQLLAFIFNVNYRLGDPGITLQVDGESMTAQEIIDAAVAAWFSEGTEDDQYWEPILDDFNNNNAVPFIHFYPCTCE